MDEHDLQGAIDTRTHNHRCALQGDGNNEGLLASSTPYHNARVLHFLLGFPARALLQLLFPQGKLFRKRLVLVKELALIPPVNNCVDGIGYAVDASLVAGTAM